VNTRTFRRAALATTSVGALVLGTALFSGATQASAATTNHYYVVGNTSNYIDTLELDYNSNEGGAGALFHGNVNNYAGYSTYEDGIVNEYTYIFDTNSKLAGHGQAVKNNAASAYNDSNQHDFRVYYYSGYTGPSQLIPEVGSTGNPANLNATLKNNNASQKAIAANG
jgi:hypothetical protein